MASKRYVVVITNARGGHLGRVKVSSLQLRLACAACVTVFVAACAMGVQGVRARHSAADAERLQGQLAILAPLVHQTQSGQALLRQRVDDAARALALLDRKAHLGPTGMVDLGQVPDDAEPSTHPALSDWVTRDTGARLTARIDSLLAQGSAVEETLADLLEYWRDAQQRLTNTPSIRPARTAYATSSYGVRIDPVYHYWVMHKGLDLGGFIGMLVYAPADGVVIWTGERGGYGQVVVLDHGLGLQTHYAHLSKYLVNKGDRVLRGEPIAEMGTTGKSTGPHLHYEVRQDGVPMDPRKFILD